MRESGIFSGPNALGEEAQVGALTKEIVISAMQTACDQCSVTLASQDACRSLQPLYDALAKMEAPTQETLTAFWLQYASNMMAYGMTEVCLQQALSSAMNSPAKALVPIIKPVISTPVSIPASDKADIFGGKLPIVLGVLAVGLAAGIYYGTKKPAVKALPNRRRGRRR